MNEQELILCDLLNCTRAQLYSDPRTLHLSGEQESRRLAINRERQKGVPLQYILGRCEFFGLEFKIQPGTFIPRPETEILVEEAISLMQGPRCKGQDLKILDIGTGAGNIAISLAKNLTNAKITAIDIAVITLDLAEQNARLHAVQKKIDFRKVDLFSASGLQFLASSFDMIVSNPPYITTTDLGHLAPEVKNEPRPALDGGKDGLHFYGQILKTAKDLLKPRGILLFEIGLGQVEGISKIIADYPQFEIREIINDYNGIERVICLDRI
ncbi:MAG: peptide chain release factor N(5)-glutamine methyltransferase [Candidatus Omnitrophica bacterium]|nr:peptide chain release factor N(5)-glutamine methyltransferase [Candidatus Omnitrophota bacterium]